MRLSSKTVNYHQIRDNNSIGCSIAWCALMMVKVASVVRQGISMTNAVDYRATKILPQLCSTTWKKSKFATLLFSVARKLPGKGIFAVIINMDRIGLLLHTSCFKNSKNIAAEICL